MRCLIVEDEKQVRESIAELVPWARLGFEAPLTAASGLEALEILRAPSDWIWSSATCACRT